MATELVQTTQSPVYKPLFANEVNAYSKSILLVAGGGVVERGAILVRTDEGTYQEAEASAIVDGKDLCVLSETVDSGAVAGGDGVIANAIFSGVLVADNLTVKGGAELTAEMKLTLRGVGLQTTASYMEAQGYKTEVEP